MLVWCFGDYGKWLSIAGFNVMKRVIKRIFAEHMIDYTAMRTDG